jgi:hypothetical protein
MYAVMRTTLILEDQLFHNAKREAAEAGTTLSEVVNRALRRQLLPKPVDEAAKEIFFMPVFGEPTVVHQSPQELARLRDEGR